MRIPTLEDRDVAVFLAIKPYMSTRAQQLFDLLLFFRGQKPRSVADLLEPVPLLTMLSLVKGFLPTAERADAKPDPESLELPGADPLDPNSDWVLDEGVTVSDDQFSSTDNFTTWEEQRGEHDE